MKDCDLKHSPSARSSIEAVYKYVVNTTSELLWLQFLLHEFGVSLASPLTLWCDNICATYLTQNPILHASTKHVELDYYFVRERFVVKSLIVSFISSKDQVVDILTCNIRI